MSNGGDDYYFTDVQVSHRRGHVEVTVGDAANPVRRWTFCLVPRDVVDMVEGRYAKKPERPKRRRKK